MENSEFDEKSVLRGRYRRARLLIGDDDRETWDEAITKRVLALPQVMAAGVVFVYLSRSGEVGTRGLVEAMLGAGKRVLTPSPDIKAMPHDGLFRVFAQGDGGKAGPPVLCRECRVDEVDVIVVPGIVWDREGYRVGFGGGYFDRLLSMVRGDCLKVGLAFECQLVDRVPREEWDERVDGVITELGEYW